jgi:cyanophycinase
MAKKNNNHRTNHRTPEDMKSHAARQTKTNGSLIIVGGHEDKTGDKVILKEIAKRSRGGKLVVATLASNEADDVWKEYQKLFRGLEVSQLEHLNVESRDQSLNGHLAEKLKGASAIFFTGGDQLKITSGLGGSALCDRIQELYENGGTIAGTSAGASAMSETMLVSGDSDGSMKVENFIRMAPGLGLIQDIIIDQHFAERGRIGRLLGAVAQNPRLLGVGIDENTAVILEQENTIQIIGEGAVYIVDGRPVTYSNISEREVNKTMSLFDVRLHVLSRGDMFDLNNRRPAAGNERPETTPGRKAQ